MVISVGTLEMREITSRLNNSYNHKSVEEESCIILPLGSPYPTQLIWQPIGTAELYWLIQ